MNEVPEITTNADLEVGRYYHCFDKSTIAHAIHQCHRKEADAPKFLAGRIWADDNNNQALERWRIYGPIDPPNVGGIYLCSDHGGYGFNSDCQRCKVLKKEIIS